MRNLIAALLLLPPHSFAGEVEIVNAIAIPGEGGNYRIEVTLRHADSGWDHYADGWEVLAPDGRRLGERTLYHPHVDEQPFTRALTGVRVPLGTDHLLIRAHDKVHGHSRQLFRLDLGD